MRNRRALTGKVFWAWCCFTITMAICLGLGLNDAQAAPTITSPPAGTTLTGSTETFSWTAGGSVVTEWWLYVGTSPGERDIYNSRSLGTATSDTVSVLPTNGATLHVRLWFRVNGEWSGTNFTYTAFRSGGSGGGLSAVPPWDQVLPAAERFVLVMGGEAVLDKGTGLVWEQSPQLPLRSPESTELWGNAALTCLRAKFGGVMGWRLPSIHELSSLIDHRNSEGNIKLPVGHPFDNVQAEPYWSATAQSENPGKVWAMFLGTGLVFSNSKTASFHVWCVRGGGPLSVY